MQLIIKNFVSTSKTDSVVEFQLKSNH